MPHLQKRRGGTAAQMASFTPSDKELVIDTTNLSIKIGDNSTLGGFPFHKFAAAHTTLTANAIIFASTTTTLSNSSALTWDGTTITIDGDLTFTGAQTITTSTGNLTISTSAGNGNIILTPHGSGTVQISAMTAGSVLFAGASGAVIQDNANLFWDDSNNRLGIGTSSPSDKFQVAGVIRTSGAVAVGAASVGDFDFFGGNARILSRGANASTAGGIQFHRLSSDASINAVSMAIDTSGNVGIGTTAPSTLLHVGLAGTTLGTIGIAGNTSGLVTLSVAAAAGTWTMKLPTGVAGTAGFQLTDAAGDGVTSWASAASTKTAKNIINQFQNTKDALNKMLSASVYLFKYKEGMGTGDLETEYVGIMAEESPWAMHFNNKILNPVSTFGYTVLSIQALHDKITALEQTINKLTAQKV